MPDDLPGLWATGLAATGPRIGPEDTEYRGLCGHMAEPGAPRCQDPAEVHLLVEHPDGYQTELATCLAHFAIAKAAAPVIDRHVYRGVCGLPGSVWSLALLRCVIDDSGVEPSLAAAEELALAAA